MRRHFIKEGRGWNPYILGGLGYQKSEETYPLSAAGPGKRKDGNLAAKVGVGLQTTFEKRVAVRAEVAYRADFDDQSIAARDESWFGDVLASVGVVIPLGPAPVAAAPAPAPVAPSLPELAAGSDHRSGRLPGAGLHRPEGRQLLLRQVEPASGRRGDPERSHRDPEALPGSAR
ncbi:hypothetical protein G6F66_014199 [Rhizopus arrhizus]|nr:hypothetical protein G6F66_014199 [Rhizopus arrhizus]